MTARTRAHLIEVLVDKLPHLSMQVIDEAVKQVFEHMGSALGSGLRVEVRGFGSFSLKYRPARVTRNPKTGELLYTTEKCIPYFKPGKELRERMNRIEQVVT